MKPINEISFFPGVKASAARTNDGIGALKNGEAIVANNVKSNSGDDDDGDVAECHALFLKPDTKEWMNKANELESFMRAVRKACLLGSKSAGAKPVSRTSSAWNDSVKDN